MHPRLLKYATTEVPRYTSYPTAVQFTDRVDTGMVSDWMGAVAADTPVSVYVHIPFCAQLCWYCGCHTSIPNTYDRVADYVRVLLDEIDIAAARCGSRAGIAHLHFGGGTPSVLTNDDLRRIVDRLSDRFGIRDGAEIAMEIDPRTLATERFDGLAAIGLNRASLGVQDFDPEVQRRINRVQSVDMVRAGVDGLRAIGVESINFDLMYGLPGQTVATALETVERSVALDPDRLAVFGYAHVPWFKKHQEMIDAASLPDTLARFEQTERIEERLQQAGYAAIGLDHFARPADELALAAGTGRLRRNFQGYTTDPGEVLIGLGASSISRFHQGYAQNAPHTGAWRSAVESGHPAVVRGVELTDDDRLHADAIERLLCDFKVDIPAVCAAHGRRGCALDGALIRLDQMIEDRMVVLDGRKVVMTADGRRFVRAAAACFDQYLQPARNRHSRAV
ncbi:MAG: oxygen-independent coproporphyrinogen III oxidase [Pseudomonadota bacterium]|nr:oxygen-independent coproporphyrinogen III oxidase [Pseudomonadota bacterium]